MKIKNRRRSFATTVTPTRKKKPDYKPSVFPPGDAAVVAPTFDAKRRVVGAARRAERQQAKRRADLKTLSATIACNVGLVQRHLGDEMLRRKRADVQASLTYCAREARAVERVTQERMDAADRATVDAKKVNRLDARRTLHGRVTAVRASIDEKNETLKRGKTDFHLTPGVFSSLIAPDEESRRQRREANLLSEWRAAVQNERHRIETLRSTNLEAYAEERLSPYVHYRGPKNRDELATFTSLVDGVGVFREDAPPLSASSLPRSPGEASTLADLSRNPWLRQPANLDHALSAGSDHLGSWEITDGHQNSEAVMGTALPPTMRSADRIYRPKPRNEPTFHWDERAPGV